MMPMPDPTAVTEELVEAIAQRVVELLDRRHDQLRRARLASASEIAAEFGVSRDWVYAHASALAAVRLGTGPKARLRFDRGQVRKCLKSHGRDGPGDPPVTPGRGGESSVDLLPVYGAR
jgi:hypothetical protein